MRRNKALQREIALQRVQILLTQCTESAKFDMDIARRQATIARTICLRFNLKLPYEMRQMFCHGCKNLMLPGRNARIRLSSKRKSVTATCLDCGYIYRKIFQSHEGKEQT